MYFTITAGFNMFLNYISLKEKKHRQSNNFGVNKFFQFFLPIIYLFNYCFYRFQITRATLKFH